MISFSRAVVAASVMALVVGALPTAAQDADNEDTVAPTEPLTLPGRLPRGGGRGGVYAPRIDTWEDFAQLEARQAVAVTPTGESEPVYGVAEFTADTDPNLELRIVAVENIKITVTSFPVPDAARREQLDAIVRATIQNRTQYVPLDVILTYIAPDASVAAEEGLSFEPPPSFYSSTPAILVMTDGAPLWAPLPDTSLQ